MRNNRGPYYLKNSEGIQNTKDPCRRSDRGQNIFEYILLVAAALLVFLALLNPQGPFGQQIESSVFNATVAQLNSLNDVQF